MSTPTAVARSSSSSPKVADDWENDAGSESTIDKQLCERMKQVKILQREKADKHARAEQARIQKEYEIATGNVSNSAPAPVVMQILRRPKSDERLEQNEKNKKDDSESSKKLTFEEKQAAYDRARTRILGSDYKPAQVSHAVDIPPLMPSRNKSPEPILMSKRQSPDCSSGTGPPSLMSTHIPPLTSVQMQPRQMYMLPPFNSQFNPCQDSYGSQVQMPYYDASRPPPPMMDPSYMSAYVQCNSPYNQPVPLGYYAATYHPQPTQAPQNIFQPPQFYAPGTLGAAMQFNVSSGPNQRKHKKHRKSNSKNEALA